MDAEGWTTVCDNIEEHRWADARRIADRVRRTEPNTEAKVTYNWHIRRLGVLKREIR